jgi:hypothetical protein
MGAIEQTREATTAIDEIWIRAANSSISGSELFNRADASRAQHSCCPFFHSRGNEEISPQVGQWVRKEICAYVHFFLDLGQQCAI